MFLATSSNTPTLNGVYNYIGSYVGPFTYDYISNNNEYMYFNFTQATTNITVTRETIPGMNDAVNSLVDNVGVDSLWNIFDTSINYVVIVILFAFGSFLVFTIIRKISKGKGDV